MSSNVPEQITAALKKLGPSAPRVIADSLGLEPSTVGYHIKEMLKAKTLQATGATLNRVIALPDQKIDAEITPPQRRKPSRKKKGNGAGYKKKPKARKARAPRATAPTPEHPFIPAIDADMRLVCLNGGAPAVFSVAQTEKIATLLLQHFKA